MKKIKRYFKGFSLIEILVTISILAALLIFSSLYVPGFIIKAKDSKTKANLYKMYIALEDYYDSSGKFPKQLPDCNQPLTYDSNMILQNIPCDPFDKSNYYYEAHPSGKWFKLYAKLRNTEDEIITTIGCLAGCGPDCQYNYGVASTNINIDRCRVPIFACGPGGGEEGHCDEYDDPEVSKCPKTYTNDPTCNNNECSNPDNRCENASGKRQPDQ